MNAGGQPYRSVTRLSAWGRRRGASLFIIINSTEEGECHPETHHRCSLVRTILAAPAFTAERGAPFEQTQLDRDFLAESASGASMGSGASSAGSSRTPYEQLRIDRGVPSHALPHEHAGRNPVWAADFNFIAPPQ